MYRCTEEVKSVQCSTEKVKTVQCSTGVQKRLSQYRIGIKNELILYNAVHTSVQMRLTQYSTGVQIWLSQ